MKYQWLLTLAFLLGIVLLLVVNELIYRRLKVQGELTRKLAHFTATISTLSFPFLFSSHWYVLFLAVFFFLILLISKKGTKLNSINDIERESAGSYLLTIAIYITFLFADLMESRLLFNLPILILAISDPIAGITGQGVKTGNRKIAVLGMRTEKTIAGSMAFFITSLIICIITLFFYTTVLDTRVLILSLLIALVSTNVELLSQKGIDNLTVPLAVIALIILFL